MERLRKDDIVEVISGVSRGKQGKLLRFNDDRTRAYIEKVNLVKKHSKASQKNPTGGIIEIESSIHVSNLMVVDPTKKIPSKVGIKTLKDGSKVRFLKKTGTELSAHSKK
ncbi:MAG: 50S ribosomal protein L24 [uncultured bacterium]|nr:MAG: 50S ribosomal protein L24 [uncultured bacterium]HLD46047.1 50S ribosomal protein L24 [bacterium]